MVKAQGVTDHQGIGLYPIHLYDGPVSLRLDWNGLSFVYSGDTTPSQFFVDNAQGADLVVDETFNTVKQLMDRSGYDERTARGIGTIAHSTRRKPARCSSSCSRAVAFHFFNDFDTAAEMEAAIRTHYKGPLALAKDLMVFNVTKEGIVTRMTVAATHVWPNKEHHEEVRKAPRKERMKMSRWLADRQLFPKF
jgi:ribonuclease Z